jgi:uncharacterized Zn-finger protein
MDCFEFVCPYCSTRFEPTVEPEDGERVDCPECGRSFAVESPEVDGTDEEVL